MNNLILAKDGFLRCSIQSTDPHNPVLEFAKRELRKYLKRSTSSTKSKETPVKILLQAGSETRDGFRISIHSNVITIHGANPSSVLIAVYAFLKRVCGYRWFAPDQEIAPQQDTLSFSLSEPWEEKAAFSRRGIYPEGGNFSQAYLKTLIDWCPKNTLSDITFSMSAWSRWKETLEPQLRKRGLSLNLSGHCLPTFVPKSMFETHPDWFALVDGKRIPNGQYCFSSTTFQRYLTRQLLQFVKQEPLLTRLSIWAQDTFLVCECPDCKETGFLKSFIDTINAISTACKQHAPRVNIEFLAYNAALSWEMLEPDPQVFPLQCSTELAYWGRDYRYAFAKSPAEGDQRAWKGYQAWRRHSDQTLHLLEYYTDLWMNTHLMTAKPTIISQDMIDFAAIGIDDMNTLIVPCPYNLTDKTFSKPDANQKIATNLYFFALNSWNPNADVFSDYCTHQFGIHRDFCEQVVRTLERTLGTISSFNTRLFRLRFVDPWYRDVTPRNGGIKFKPQAWDPEQEWRKVDEDRRRAGQGMIEKLNTFIQKTPWPDDPLPPATRRLREHWAYIQDNLQCLQHQFEAQKQMTLNQWHLADDQLEQALRYTAVITPTDRCQCLTWKSKMASRMETG